MQKLIGNIIIYMQNRPYFYHMIGDIFYSFGVIILILNTFVLFRYRGILKVIEWISKFKKVVKRLPIKSDYRSPDDRGLLLVWSFTFVVTTFWMLFGLLGKGWIMFSSLIISSFLLNVSIKVAGEFSKVSYLIGVFKYFIIISTMLFLILNHFHFHLDLLKLIK